MSKSIAEQETFKWPGGDDISTELLNIQVHACAQQFFPNLHKY